MRTHTFTRTHTHSCNHSSAHTHDFHCDDKYRLTRCPSVSHVLPCRASQASSSSAAQMDPGVSGRGGPRGGPTLDPLRSEGPYTPPSSPPYRLSSSVLRLKGEESHTQEIHTHARTHTHTDTYTNTHTHGDTHTQTHNYMNTNTNTMT